MHQLLRDLTPILEAALKEFTDDIRDDAMILSHELRWDAFPQMWPSTALGYGGVGGHAMTSAQTVVVTRPFQSDKAIVFFGRPRVAYVADVRKPAFQGALKERAMPHVRKAEELLYATVKG